MVLAVPIMEEGSGGEDRRVVPLHPERVAQDKTAMLGMVVFVTSWVMLFMALFFVFAMVRVREPFWPPVGVTPLPLGLPILNTLIIGLSSFALLRGGRALQAGDLGRTQRGVLIAIALGALFMVLQVQLWSQMLGQELNPSSSLYGGFFYVLTGVHAAHVFVGWALLIWVAASLRGVSRATWALRVRMIGLFWHFVGAVWVVLFLLVFP